MINPALLKRNFWIFAALCATHALPWKRGWIAKPPRRSTTAPSRLRLRRAHCRAVRETPISAMILMNRTQITRRSLPPFQCAT